MCYVRSGLLTGGPAAPRTRPQDSSSGESSILKVSTESDLIEFEGNDSGSGTACVFTCVAEVDSTARDDTSPKTQGAGPSSAPEVRRPNQTLVSGKQARIRYRYLFFYFTVKYGHAFLIRISSWRSISRW